MSNSVPSIAANWKARLYRTFEGIFVFEETRHGLQTVTQARSKHAVLELRDEQGVLRQSHLQLTLQGQDELEMLKLSCWTLLYLKSLFPRWGHIEEWVQRSGNRVTERKGPIQEKLDGYLVACEYNALRSVMEYRISLDH